MRAAAVTVLVLFTYFCNAQQDMGMIEVDENNTATLVFLEKIDFIVIGNNPPEGAGFLFYDVFQDGRMCVIRGNTDKAPLTSITVKLINEKVYFGKLKFGTSTKIFYDFSGKDREEKEQLIEKEKVIEAKSEAIDEERLDQLMKEKQEYFVYGIRESNVEYIVSNIRNDDKNTYIKMIINNNTAGDYNIDGILFKFVEGKRRGAKKNEAKTEERIMPKRIKGPEIATAYTKTEIGIIIPLFSVGNSGDLEIQLREKNGTRNPLIRISGKDMLKVKVF